MSLVRIATTEKFCFVLFVRFVVYW